MGEADVGEAAFAEVDGEPREERAAHEEGADAVVEGEAGHVGVYLRPG